MPGPTRQASWQSPGPAPRCSRAPCSSVDWSDAFAVARPVRRPRPTARGRADAIFRGTAILFVRALFTVRERRWCGSAASSPAPAARSTSWRGAPTRSCWASTSAIWPSGRPCSSSPDRVVVSTIVEVRNRRGRAYSALVRRIHPWVVRTMLARAWRRWRCRRESLRRFPLTAFFGPGMLVGWSPYLASFLTSCVWRREPSAQVRRRGSRRLLACLGRQDANSLGSPHPVPSCRAPTCTIVAVLVAASPVALLVAAVNYSLACPPQTSSRWPQSRHRLPDHVGLRRIGEEPVGRRLRTDTAQASCPGAWLLAAGRRPLALPRARPVTSGARTCNRLHSGDAALVHTSGGRWSWSRSGTPRSMPSRCSSSRWSP